MPTVAVVVLNWNGERYLRKFLPSVCRHSGGLAEVVVADNGSSDASRQVVQELCPAAHWVELQRNWGYAEGYNRALSWVRTHLQSEMYVLLNSDAEVPSGWLPPLLARMQTREHIAAVMPKILNYHHPNQFEYAGACGGFLDRYGYPYCRGRIVDTVEVDQGQYNAAMPIHWASGACLMVRSEAFWQVGGFAGHFFAHMEEIDLCWRIRRAGWEVWVEPAAAILHVGGASLDYANPKKLFLNHRNGLWMLRRNLTHRRRRTLLLRICLDCASACYRLAHGQWQHAWAVVKGISAGMRAHVGIEPMGNHRTNLPNPNAEIAQICILHEYYVRGHRTYSQLPIPAGASNGKTESGG